MIQKMKKQAIRSKSKFLANNVAVVVLLVLMNVRAVMVTDTIRYAEQGTIPFRQKMIKKLDS
jgi:hypothetical protein